MFKVMLRLKEGTGERQREIQDIRRDIRRDYTAEITLAHLSFIDIKSVPSNCICTCFLNIVF